mmetsp:Transcript_20618/g.43107  ORF Transcript_20618/g.43107 Transcript_20618/m.43107 type:complete len:90 (-) Transcript_20618:572-841(-)
MCFVESSMPLHDRSEYRCILFDSDVGNPFLFRICFGASLRENLPTVQITWRRICDTQTTNHIECPNSVDGCTVCGSRSGDIVDIYVCRP